MSRKADVAFVLHSLQGGGVERATLNLSASLARRGLEIDLVLCTAEGPFLDHVAPGVGVVDLEAGTSLAWRGALEGYLAERPPETVCAGMEGAGVVTLWACRRTGAPSRTVVVSHNTFSRHSAEAAGFKERYLLPWFVRWLYRDADAVVAVSEGVADDLARTAWLPRERIRVLYNPVVTDAVEELAAEVPDHDWLRSADREVVVSAGRLTAQKDFETLLRAFALVREERDTYLVVLGEGEERDALEGLADELGIGGRVSFPGFDPNPYAWFARADLFVLSSAWEGFGIVLIEAMACGCPVVSTDCPSGPAEILEHGRHGRLVPVGDAPALARAMIHVLENPPDPGRLRDRAMDFHADRIAESYLDVLLPSARDG